jgi:hypothetical protein
MKCFRLSTERSERQWANIRGKLSDRMNFPPGLVYNSALFCPVILSPLLSATVRCCRSEWPKKAVPAIQIFWLFLVFRQERSMKKLSEAFLLKAHECAELALEATDDPTRRHYRRMEAAWRDMAREQDWLDGEVAANSTQNAA